LTKLVEKFALWGFGEEITDHLFRGTMFNGEFVIADAVCDKIEPAIEMLVHCAVCRLNILSVRERWR
jgi:hypothetical protein